MSLNIEVDDVEVVLLDDGWHRVKGHSFDLDAYEFTGGGNPIGSGVGGATGFLFDDADSGRRMYGPLTAIKALGMARP